MLARTVAQRTKSGDLDIALLAKIGFPYEKVQAMSKALNYAPMFSGAGPKKRVAGEDFVRELRKYCEGTRNCALKAYDLGVKVRTAGPGRTRDLAPISQ